MPISQLMRSLEINLNVIDFPDFHIAQRSQKFQDFLSYIQTMNDVSKQIAELMEMRRDAEMEYARRLARIGAKLARTCRERRGQCFAAWNEIANLWENEGKLHMDFAKKLDSSIVKKNWLACNIVSRTRKSLQELEEKNFGKFDRELKNMYILKMGCHNDNRTREKLQERILDSTVDVQQGDCRPDSLAKLEQNCDRMEENLERKEENYLSVCLNAEMSRHMWLEVIIYGSRLLGESERDRTEACTEAVDTIARHAADLASKFGALAAKVSIRLDNLLSPSQDRYAADQFTDMVNGEHRQFLPDFYSENLTHPMGDSRRATTLLRTAATILKILDTEPIETTGIEAEVGSKRLYLQATLFKLVRVMDELKIEHPYQQAGWPLDMHLVQYKNRKGMIQTIHHLTPPAVAQ